MLKQILDQMQQEMREENWDKLPALDNALRQVINDFSKEPQTSDAIQSMLVDMEVAKALYRDVIFTCQRHRTSLKQQQQQLQKGKKAVGRYLAQRAFA